MGPVVGIGLVVGPTLVMSLTVFITHQNINIKGRNKIRKEKKKRVFLFSSIFLLTNFKFRHFVVSAKCLFGEVVFGKVSCTVKIVASNSHRHEN